MLRTLLICDLVRSELGSLPQPALDQPQVLTIGSDRREGKYRMDIISSGYPLETTVVNIIAIVVYNCLLYKRNAIQV